MTNRAARARRGPRTCRSEASRRPYSALDRGFQVLVYTTLLLRNRETIAAFEAAMRASTR
jgi:hypothetical protein